jgi:hypothetical protein
MPEMDKKEIEEVALRLLEEINNQTKYRGQIVHSTKLATTIGSTEQQALEGWEYLKERKLIDTPGSSGHTGPASANSYGLEALLNAVKQPDRPAPGFSSITYNTIHIQQMQGGAIAQAGPHSTQQQTITYNQQDFAELLKAIDILERHIDELRLDDAGKSDAQAQVDTIKAQLRTKPNQIIIREAGKSLRSITEGIIGGLVASRIEHWQLVYDVLMRMF